MFTQLMVTSTATYGYLDGEYAFSAALLLVMVNAAFPRNDTNARTMEMALGLLRGMADRGNTYLGSRHSPTTGASIYYWAWGQKPRRAAF